MNSGTELYFVLDGEVEVESQGVRLGFLSEGTPHTMRLEFLPETLSETIGVSHSKSLNKMVSKAS